MSIDQPELPLGLDEVIPPKTEEETVREEVAVRDRVLDAQADKSATTLEWLRAEMVTLYMERRRRDHNTSVNANDARKVLSEHGKETGPWMGALFRTKAWVKTGGTTKSSAPGSHARIVWDHRLAEDASLPAPEPVAPQRRVLHPAIKAKIIVGRHGEEVSPQVHRGEWKAVRGPLVGSSDLAALLGVDEYQGPWQVWDRIVLGKWDDQDHADIRRGNRQEPNALKRFSEMFGLTTEPVGMISHRSDPRIVSDLDALVHRPEVWPEVILDNPLWDHVRENCTGPGALEAKVPRTARFFQYRDEGMLKGHAIQMQHHLEVAGLEWGVLTFYNPEYDTCIAFPVVAEPKIGEWIRTQVPAWYKRYVDTRERPMHPMPPPPEWPSTAPGEATVREDGEWRDAATFLSLRYYELAEAQQAYEQTETNLLALLGDGIDECHVVGGGVVVKRTESKGQRRFDTKAFLAAVALAQQENDTQALIDLNPADDKFYYQTTPKKKVDVEVKVVGGNPAEIGA